MNSKIFEQLINRIYRTADDELDCEQVDEMIAAYVDSLVDKGLSEAHYSDIRLHLEQCPDCDDLYQSLLRAARFESRDVPPTTAELLAALTPHTKSKTGDAGR